MIFAMSKNGIIGNQGQLPWYIPEDLRHFKNTTMGSTVIMGRKTWQSIEDKYKPLTGRDNIVLTTQKNFDAPGATVVNSFDEALAAAHPDKPIWVIGGGEIYRLALPFVDTLSITEVDVIIEGGDTYAPYCNWAEWDLYKTAPGLRSITGVNYEIKQYNRRKQSGFQIDESIMRNAQETQIVINKPVSAWVLYPNDAGLPTYSFEIYTKPTQEQIENTQKLLGWGWKDY